MDREKIVNAFVLCRVNEGCSTNCPYWNGNASVKECTKKLATDVYSLLKEQPEIVRCKDCKHATMTIDGKMCKYCAMDTDDFGDQRDVYHDADWFCADGEREDENG